MISKNIHVYSAIPNLVVVDEKWMPLLEPLFTPLFCLPIFYTSLDHGKWIEIEDCIFDCLKEDAETKEVCIFLVHLTVL